MKKRSRSYSDESGTTLIETAYAMPIFLLLILGILIFSQFIVRKIIVTRSVTVAAREAAFGTSSCQAIALTEMATYLTGFKMQSGVSLNVQPVSRNGVRGLEVIGVSGEWCQFCQSYLGIGPIHSKIFVPLEDSSSVCA